MLNEVKCKRRSQCSTLISSFNNLPFFETARNGEEYS